MVSSEKRGIHRFLLILTAMAALGVLVRIIWIATASPEYGTPEYRDPEVSSQVVRGTVTDRNGRIIAIETPYHACALLLRDVVDLERTAGIIAPALSLEAGTIIEEARDRSTYLLVKRRLTDTEYDDLSRLVQEYGLKGVVLEKRYGRTYPQMFHGAQTIGFTNTENRGIEGLELACESLLSPYPELKKGITYGRDITLTLDLDLQYLLDAQAVEIDRLHHPDNIVGIIMGAKTGEILASTTFPWYDPNAYSDSEPLQRQNRVITSMFEPGSVFKVFTLAAELEAGQADFDEPFYCDGRYTFTMPNGSEATINCVEAHGQITPETMIKYSCNGAAAHWALQTDDGLFRKTLTDLGFGSVWDIGLPGEIPGVVSDIDSWSGRTKATMAFGQEIGVTALQIATAATAIANEGNLMKPFLVKSVTTHEGKTVASYEPEIAFPTVFSKQTAQTVLNGMEAATQKGGTATRTAVEGIPVAAKTGTAQIADPRTGRYLPDSFLASTLAIVPADDPQYIIYIGVTNPKGSTIWGSNIAAPAIGSVIADMARQGKLFSERMERITIP